MQQKPHKELIEKYNADHIIQSLTPYVSTRRQQRINEVIQDRLDSVQLAIESPSDINNALAAVRSSEAFGISKIHIICPEGDAKGIRPITQGAFYWIDIIYYESFDEFLKMTRTQYFNLAGATIDAQQSLSEISITKPLCLLIGNEQRGLSKSAQGACDMRYRIPMYGMSESLNLSVSAAISLYDTTSRKRQLIKQNGDLESAQKKILQAEYYLNSVNSRLINALIK